MNARIARELAREAHVLDLKGQHGKAEAITKRLASDAHSVVRAAGLASDPLAVVAIDEALDVVRLAASPEARAVVAQLDEVLRHEMEGLLVGPWTQISRLASMRKLALSLDPTDEHLLNSSFGGDVMALKDFKARLAAAADGGLTSAKLSKMLERSSPFMQGYEDRVARKAASSALNYLHSSISDAAKGPEVQQWAASVHQPSQEELPAEEAPVDAPPAMDAAPSADPASPSAAFQGGDDDLDDLDKGGKGDLASLLAEMQGAPRPAPAAPSVLPPDLRAAIDAHRARGRQNGWHDEEGGLSHDELSADQLFDRHESLNDLLGARERHQGELAPDLQSRFDEASSHRDDAFRRLQDFTSPKDAQSGPAPGRHTDLDGLDAGELQRRLQYTIGEDRKKAIESRLEAMGEGASALNAPSHTVPSPMPAPEGGLPYSDLTDFPINAKVKLQGSPSHQRFVVVGHDADGRPMIKSLLAGRVHPHDVEGGGRAVDPSQLVATGETVDMDWATSKPARPARKTKEAPAQAPPPAEAPVSTSAAFGPPAPASVPSVAEQLLYGEGAPAVAPKPATPRPPRPPRAAPKAPLPGDAPEPAPEPATAPVAAPSAPPAAETVPASPDAPAPFSYSFDPFAREEAAPAAPVPAEANDPADQYGGFNPFEEKEPAPTVPTSPSAASSSNDPSASPMSGVQPPAAPSAPPAAPAAPAATPSSAAQIPAFLRNDKDPGSMSGFQAAGQGDQWEKSMMDKVHAAPPTAAGPSTQDPMGMIGAIGNGAAGGASLTQALQNAMQHSGGLSWSTRKIFVPLMNKLMDIVAKDTAKGSASGAQDFDFDAAARHYLSYGIHHGFDAMVDKASQPHPQSGTQPPQNFVDHLIQTWNDMNLDSIANAGKPQQAAPSAAPMP